MMFNEVDFLDRFDAAAMAGFKGVEFLFPYEWDAVELRAKLEAAGLDQVLFNLYPGDFTKGDRGLGAMPGREAEFDAALDQALDYAGPLGHELHHVITGTVPAGPPREASPATLTANL